jgi:pyruvate dehydrogenase E2 component (dihydrolipoamide acetyltransferase)
MQHVFKLQDPGEGIHEAEVVEVRVAAGEEVHEGDVLMVVETDKAAIDLPSPYAGRIESVEVSAGDIVEVGAVLVRFTNGRAGDAERGADGDEAPATRQGGQHAGHEAGEGHEVRGRRLVHQRSGNGEPVRASPATRKLARELDVDLAEVPASGEAHRVLERDVRTFAAHAEDQPAQDQPSRPQRTGGQRQQLKGPRRVTARRMAEAWREIPHVTHTVEADITELESFRADAQAAHPDLSLTVLLLRAVAACLQQHPRFNAQLDAERQEIELESAIHIGVAVATEHGLLVPVVRDVPTKSFDALGAELAELIEKAHARSLGPDQLRGGTFTITNLAGAGGVHFTPLINPPQVAILGVATARWVAVVQDDHRSIAPRLLLPLILAFDHRVNDGMDAAHFASTLTEMLAAPGNLLLRL